MAIKHMIKWSLLAIRSMLIKLQLNAAYHMVGWLHPQVGKYQELARVLRDWNLQNTDGKNVQLNSGCEWFGGFSKKKKN